MKVQYTTKNGKMTVELEADGHAGLWKELASFQEVFEEDTCGKCDSNNLKYVVRKASDAKGKEYSYHELRCKDCWAKLAFGVIDDGKGSLFPKRKDDEGKWKGKFGWTKFNKDTQQEE